MRLLNNPNFQFMSFRKTAFFISLSIILFSLGSLIMQGGPKYGIDFQGGTILEMQFKDPANPQATVTAPIDKVREVFSNMNFSGAEIRTFGSSDEIAARVGADSDMSDAVIQQLLSNLSSATGMEVVERRRETVGPKIGKELVSQAIWAILFAMVLILIYIVFRFEFSFGLGAVAALFHDIIITLGVFSIAGVEISVPVIAALLTIIGYSLNDTIVVFDRIRENLKSYSRKVQEYAALVNKSINETLSRTIVTSGTTMIAVVILYFFGGEILKDFALALICGVIVGTYSSIFIASPLLVEWDRRNQTAVATAKKK